MNTLLATLTIVALSICSTDKYSIKEDRTIKKSTNTQKEKVIIYKKVPTKWVKITKNLFNNVIIK